MSTSVGRGCRDEVRDLQPGMDFRRPEYRREVFHRFYEFHLRHRSHPGAVYYMFPWLAARLNMDIEQRLWFAYINGCTQHVVTTYLIYKQFPSIQGLNVDKLEEWFSDGRVYYRLGWDTDRRYHKRIFSWCVENYRQLLDGDSQAKYFMKMMDKPPVETFVHHNFDALWGRVYNSFYSFGRLSTFSYLEYLRIMGLPIDCSRLFLEDMQGSKSHRNGLALVLGRDDLDWHDSNPEGFAGRYTKAQLSWLEEEGDLLLAEAKQRADGKAWERDVSYFTLESALCTYKGWHRPNRRYPNVYNDMFHDRIKATERAWPQEDFSLFWRARQECLPAHLRLEDNPCDVGMKPEKQNHYRLTGQVIMMEEDWPCFGNSYNDRVRKEQYDRLQPARY